MYDNTIFFLSNNVNVLSIMLCKNILVQNIKIKIVVTMKKMYHLCIYAIYSFKNYVKLYIYIYIYFIVLIVMILFIYLNAI